uniref:Fibronectin type-III domain-containing protein n=1 Tax=Meloidogyne javanica TaxID=6303 RepID=A0A915N7N9_MELJA
SSYKGEEFIESFIVERKTGERQRWRQLQRKTAERIKTDTGEYVYTIQGLYPGESYAFRVLAFNEIGESEPSKAIDVDLPQEQSDDEEEERKIEGIRRRLSSTEILQRKISETLPPLERPSKPTVSTDGLQTKAILSWEQVDRAMLYGIERRRLSASRETDFWLEVANIERTTFIDRSIYETGRYVYRVVAKLPGVMNSEAGTQSEEVFITVQNVLEGGSKSRLERRMEQHRYPEDSDASTSSSVQSLLDSGIQDDDGFHSPMKSLRKKVSLSKEGGSSGRRKKTKTEKEVDTNKIEENIEDKSPVSLEKEKIKEEKEDVKPDLKKVEKKETKSEENEIKVEKSKKQDEQEVEIKKDSSVGFEVPLNDIEAVEGQLKVEMVAKLEKSTRDSLMRAEWFKDGKLLNARTLKHKSLLDNKGEAKLVINKIENSDEGLYKLELELSNREQTKPSTQAYLSVRGKGELPKAGIETKTTDTGRKPVGKVAPQETQKTPPKFVKKPKPNAESIKGSRICLSGSFSGFPFPKLKWLRNGKEFLADEFILLNINYNEDLELNEVCRPRFFARPKPHKQVAEGKSLRLKAAISANPLPQVYWDRNEGVAFCSANVQVVELATPKSSTESLIKTESPINQRMKRQKSRSEQMAPEIIEALPSEAKFIAENSSGTIRSEMNLLVNKAIREDDLLSPKFIESKVRLRHQIEIGDKGVSQREIILLAEIIE